MAKLLRSLLLLVAGVAAGDPKKSAAVDKVLEMLKDVAKKATAEGEEEAKTFVKFDRFCNDTVEETSTSITEAVDKIKLLSGDISVLNATNANTAADIPKLETDIATLAASIKDKSSDRADEASEYKKSSKDIGAAVTGIDKAIAEMKAKKATSFLQKRNFKKTVQAAALLAESLGLKNNGTGSFDLDSEVSSYDGIIDMLEGLQTQFRTARDSADLAEAKAVNAFKLEAQAATQSLKNQKNALAAKKSSLAQNTKAIAEAKQERVETKSTKKQDSDYLAETIASCSEKRKIHAQHVSTRADELAALSQATDVIKDATSSSPKSAKDAPAPAAPSGKANGLLMEVAAAASHNQGLLLAAEAEASAIEREERTNASPLGFLQRREFHRPRQGQLSTDDGLSQQRQALVSLLSHSAERLHSQQLAAIALKAKSDPFGPIKTLISDLITKMQKQMAESQTQKAYCDKEIGAAELTRGEASKQISALNSELASTQARKDSLQQELRELNATATALDTKKAELVKIRTEESKQTAETISESGAALKGVAEAKKVITDFYSSASKGTGLMQKPDQAYKGDQAASTGIIGILEVIESDFQRSISEAKSSEAAAVKEQQKILNDMAVTRAEKSKSTEVQQKFKDDAELKISDDTSDLKAETSKLESALLQLKILEDKCGIGVTYDERKAKRAEEMQALEDAIAAIDGMSSLR